jgi:glutathione S-transferase
MLPTLDIAASVLASTLRQWRGTLARPGPVQPALMLELYDIENCPYCRLVREVLTELDLDALILPCPGGGQRFRPQAREIAGKAQFPLLVDRNTDTRMLESADIIAYLFREYGGRRAPPAWRRVVDLPGSMTASAMRPMAGMRARASQLPGQPLELFSFESSPYSRRVRELLCELEIPYRLRNTGKAQWRDMGPPGLRSALFPQLPVSGRNRLELLERAGRVQVPWLFDPNTEVALFESAAIRQYLLDNYALG